MARAPIYDDQKEKFDDIVGRIDPAEQEAMENRAYNGAAEDIAEREGLYNPDEDDDSDDGRSASPKKLKEAEAKGAGGGDTKTDTAAGGGTGAGPDMSRREKLTDANVMAGMNANPLTRGAFKLFNSLTAKQNRKKTLIGGGITGIVAGLVVASLVSFPQVKVLGITQNLQDIFFSNVDDAAERFDENLFKHYVIKKVMPGMIRNNCTSTRASKSCAYISGTDNIIMATYRAWRDANLEGKMYEKYGWEIRRDGHTNTFYLRANHLNGELDLGTYSGNTRTFEGKVYAELSRTDARRVTREATAGETLAKRIRYHYTVGRLLEYKHNIRRCLVACTTRDKFSDSVDNKKRAWKSYAAERLLTPYSESVGLALECALNGFSCANITQADDHGVRETEYETNLRARLQAYRAEYGTKKLDELHTQAEEIRKLGFGNYIIKRIAGETVAKIAGKFIPVYQWIQLAAQVGGAAKNVGPALVAINYVMNINLYVNTFSMLRTAGDEIKTGDVEGTIEGSIAVGAFDQNPDNDQGGAAADQSPLYQTLMDPAGRPTVNPFASLIPSVAAADQTLTPHCDDGKPYQRGDLVCPELSFRTHSVPEMIASHVSDVAHILNFFGGYFSQFFNSIDSAIWDFLIPNWVEEFGAWVVQHALAPFMDWIQKIVLKYIFVVPISENASGARTFEMAAGGADAAANEVAQGAFGASTKSKYQIQTIRDEQLRERKAEFAARPLHDRLFDKYDSRSLISQVALATPSSTPGVFNSIASSVSGLFHTFSTGLAGTFIPAYAGAAAPLDDPFAISQKAYAPNAEVLTLDPTKDNYEDYYARLKCDNPNQAKEWADSWTRVNADTGQIEPDSDNPCMMMNCGIAESAGVFDKSLLDKCAFNDQSATAVAAPISTAPGGIGQAGGFTFPLVTTQSAIKNHSPHWCYNKPTNCHHDYPAADIYTNRGTVVVAAKGGTIITKKHANDKCKGGLGGYPTMQIAGDDGKFYFYAHFEPGSLTSKGPGNGKASHVDAGEKLGTVGYALCGQGISHLHIQWFNSIIGGNSSGSDSSFGMEIQPPLIKAFQALPQ